MIIKYLKNTGQISYPVGDYIEEAINFVNSALIVLMKDKNFPKSDIAIWCRGSSGAILAGLLANGLLVQGYQDITVNHVKKENEKSHSANFFFTKTTNIIIDDFTCTGDTINHIAKCMKKSIFHIDYMIFSGVALKNYPSDYKNERLAGTPKGLTFPVPHNLLVPDHYTLVKYKKLLQSLKATNLRDWQWELEEE